jgi:hypothetical protein
MEGKMIAKRVVIITLLLITISMFLSAPECIADNVTAESPSYADVNTAVQNAQPGDTVVVPSGIVTWNKTLKITKGITLSGAGIGKTVVRGIVGSSIGELILYQPTNPQYNEPFRVTGFTFEGEWEVGGIKIYNWTTSLIDKVRIDHNHFFECNGRGIYWDGFCYGLVDNNEFEDCRKACDVYGKYWESWEMLPAILGSTQSVVIESNSFSYSESRVCAGITSAGHGGRYTFRYNTVYWPAGYPYFQICDAHGNQYPVTEEFWGNHRGTVFCEIYENTITTDDNHYRFLHHRGGIAIVFNNVLAGANTVDWEMTEEDGYRIYSEFGSEPPFDAPYLTEYPGYDPIKETYIWNNIWNGSTITPSLANPDTDAIFIQEGRDYFLYEKPAYIPLEFPHPLTKTESIVGPPSKLRIKD